MVYFVPRAESEVLLGLPLEIVFYERDPAKPSRASLDRFSLNYNTQNKFNNNKLRGIDMFKDFTSILNF